MSSIKVNCGKIDISNNDKICIISGPCQLESEQHAMDMAGKIKEITSKFGLGFIYKTSFDKANRTSLKGKRGVGLENSLPVFDKIKKEIKEIAIQSCRALNIFGFARVDFFLEKSSNKIFLNEINTITGFTENSMFPKLWRASGLNIEELVAKLVDISLDL